MQQYYNRCSCVVEDSKIQYQLDSEGCPAIMYHFDRNSTTHRAHPTQVYETTLGYCKLEACSQAVKARTYAASGGTCPWCTRIAWLASKYSKRTPFFSKRGIWKFFQSFRNPIPSEVRFYFADDDLVRHKRTIKYKNYTNRVEIDIF